MSKKTFFKNVNYDKSLKLEDGTFVHSYKELINELKLLSDKEFKKYLEQDKDFFISWILENYEDKKLIENLRKSDSRKAYIKTLEKFLKKSSYSMNDLLYERNLIKQKKLNIIHNIWIIVCLVFLIIILGQQTYFESSINSLRSYNTLLLDDIYDLNSKNLMLELQIINKEYLIEESKDRVLYLESINEELLAQLAVQNLRGPIQRISEQDITVFRNTVTITVQNPLFAKFTDTESMHPTLNSDSKAIQIRPLSPEEIFVGDIISFNKGEGDIIHRVIEIGQDEEGWFAITKGDNVNLPDSKIVRFEDIDRLLVAIIY
ncbi:MAG: hypothetical protein ACMXX9_00430 [Candidatus Woesearchaeota archaeon]